MEHQNEHRMEVRGSNGVSRIEVLDGRPVVGVGRMISRRGLWPRVFSPVRGSVMLRRSMG